MDMSLQKCNARKWACQNVAACLSISEELTCKNATPKKTNAQMIASMPAQSVHSRRGLGDSMLRKEPHGDEDRLRFNFGDMGDGIQCHDKGTSVRLS